MRIFSGFANFSQFCIFWKTSFSAFYRILNFCFTAVKCLIIVVEYKFLGVHHFLFSDLGLTLPSVVNAIGCYAYFWLMIRAPFFVIPEWVSWINWDSYLIPLLQNLHIEYKVYAKMSVSWSAEWEIEHCHFGRLPYSIEICRSCSIIVILGLYIECKEYAQILKLSV